MTEVRDVIAVEFRARRLYAASVKDDPKAPSWHELSGAQRGHWIEQAVTDCAKEEPDP